MDKLVVGCGYVGRRMAMRWREQGHRVYATTRNPDHAVTLRGQGIMPILCDVLVPASLRSLPAVDTVLYAVSWDRKAQNSQRDVYVTGLTNVLANLPPPARFLYIGSTSVYGQVDGEKVDETAETNPVEESGRVLLEAEQVLRRLCHNAVVLRFAGIYGPGRILRRQAIQVGEPLVGAPDKWLNLIHVEDGVAALLAAEQRAKDGALFNVSDGEPVRRCDFYTLLAQLLGAPQPHFVPPAPGQPLPSHERAHRRIVNHRLGAELGVKMTFPSYRDGLPASLRDR